MKTLDERLDDIVKESVAEVVARADKVVRPRGAGNSRHEPKDSADFFPTPAWATRALIEHVFKPLNLYNPGNAVWEPACGALNMVHALTEYYNDVTATDIDPRRDAWGDIGRRADFFTTLPPTERLDDCKWVITNPPFNLFIPFFEYAMIAAIRGVAMFVPLTALEGKMRYEKIFKRYAGNFCVAPFVERVPIIKNHVRRDATTARAYAWLVVTENAPLPPLLHIPPCRKQLERDADYAAAYQDALPTAADLRGILNDI